MKKFLTVLLALSVVFTYTVGSAFAAAVPAAADTPYDIALDKVDAKAADVKADAAKDGTYDSAAIATAIEEAKKAGYTKAQALYETYIKDKDEPKETQFYTEVENWINTEFETAYEAVVVKSDYDIKIAAAKNLVASIKASDYIDADQKKVADYKAKVLNALDTVEAKENDITILALWRSDVSKWDHQPLSYRDAINIYLYGAGANWKPVYDADDKLADVVAGTQNQGAVKGLFVMLDALTTVEEDKEDEVITDAYIENIIANITFNAKAAADGFYLTNKVAAGDSVKVDANKEYYGVKVANAKKITAAEAAAINNAMMAVINDTLEVVAVRVQWVADKFGKAELDKQVNWYKDNFGKAMEKALPAKDFYGDVTAYAAKMKNAVNFAGDKKYNDADIDKALADAKYAIYGGYYEGGFGTVASYFSKVMPIYDDVALAIKAAYDKWQNEIKYSGNDKTAEADRKYCANYYAGYNGAATTAPSSVEWQKKYTEIKTDAQEALKEAKTVDEVNAIMADADKALTELRTAENDNVALKNAIDKYEAALAEYADEQAKLAGTAANDKYLSASYEAAEFAGQKLLSAVTKIDELVNAYSEAKALFANIKDKAALKAEANKVQDMIIALPTTAPRLENETAYMAAYDAYKAYLENYGANERDVRDHMALESAMLNLKELQVAAVKDTIRAMLADKTVTRAEYEAAKAMYDKYVDYYDQYDELFETGALKAALKDAYKQLWQDEVDAVKDMIAKLTTASSVKDIIAAKNAYDALTGSQQRAVKHEFGTAWVYKLELMKDAQKRAVESLKLTASSSAKKGSITVKWTVKGDTSVTEAYEIWKSTKKNRGFKKAFTTKDGSKKWYKNTANLKKGTRYYYKVRAIAHDTDGNKITSDWSNKAYRYAK